MRPLRRPFERLLRGVVTRSLSATAGEILEIGAGDGQLLELLPPELGARLVCTEPLELAAREFEARHPERQVIRASAESLPFPDAAFDAVVGLCVLDVVDDLPAAARELARVLRPGGRLIHWLDMSTVLTSVFQLLAQSTFVPLPNVIGDTRGQRWPEDLLLVPAPDLHKILEVVRHHRHPLAAALEHYLAVFATRPFPLERALLEYTALAESRDQRAALRSLFSQAMLLGDRETRLMFEQFRAQPVSSARFFEGRLKESFTDAAGFAIESSDVQTTSEVVPSVELAPLRYLALCIGRSHEQRRVPPRLLSPGALQPGETEMLVELGVHVFVARAKQVAERGRAAL